MKFLRGILLLLVLCTLSVAKIPRLVPEAYWGHAFLDGNPASMGSNITVESYDIGEIVGYGSVVNDDGLYSLDVIFDNELTDEDEGADNGERLTWKINGITCNIPSPGSDTAISGNVNKNFTITAMRYPEDSGFTWLIVVIAIILGLISYFVVKRNRLWDKNQT